MIKIRPASEWADGEPGLFADVPDAEYFAYPAVSNSLLSGRTPAHMRVYRDGGRKDTPSLVLGRAWHSGVLRPMDFIRRYDVAQSCKAELKSGGGCTATGRSRHGGVWYCGRHTPDTPEDSVEPVSPADFEAIMHAAEMLRSDRGIRDLLDMPGGFEVSVRWLEEGIPCKARVDFLAPGDGLVIDYKTARDASPQGFARAAANFRYNRQQAWYTEGLESLGVPVYRFLFLAQEKDPPYAYGAYTIPDHAVSAGAAEAASRLIEYVRATVTDEWPAYTTGGVTELEWPAWADLEYSELEEHDAYLSEG